MKILDNHLSEMNSGETLNGQIAFQLHDTYGFPMELTQEIAEEMGVGIDQDSFDKAMREQRDRAKADSVSKGITKGIEIEIQKSVESLEATQFVGYESLSCESSILFANEKVIIVDKTPFYAEAGGQIGDSGVITGRSGKALISDTTSLPSGQYLHMVEELDGELTVGEIVQASVDEVKRLSIQRHHTGTHLLHWALREVLGDHVKQQGSWVGPERLRFDFSHYGSLSEDEIETIEDLVNKEIFSDSNVEVIETEMDEAKRLGAIAFFGDKYGDTVRVLKAGGNSIELCGGTHVTQLSDIGPLKIISEGSIGSNIRRIEAVVEDGSIQLIRDHQKTLEEIANTLGVSSANTVEGLTKKIREVEELQEEILALRRAFVLNEVEKLVQNAQNGVLVQRVEGIGREDLKDLVMQLKSKETIEIVVLGVALENGGAAIAAAVSDQSSHDASELISEASKVIKGGGGKGKDFAMAGGKDAQELDQALSIARKAAGID